MSAKHQTISVDAASRLDELRQLLDTRLQSHWFVQVEHTPHEPQHPQQGQHWQAWTPSRFTPEHSERLLEDIQSCQAQYPQHGIRLRAERSQPYTQMYYWLQYPKSISERQLPSMTLIEGGRSKTV